MATDLPLPLTHCAYREHFDADVERILAVAPSHPSAPVAGCPGWDVAEVVRHTGEMYLRRLATIRSGLPIQQCEPLTRGPKPGEEVLAWYAGQAAELGAELASRDENEPTWTFWPGDMRIGFWARRMAQETVVHRADVELAAGRRVVIDEALAVDGIDELLRVFLCAGSWRNDTPPAEPTSVLVRAGDIAWTVRLAHTWVSVTTPTTDTDAQVVGSGTDLLLWLWGRAGAVTVDGDRKAVDRLRTSLIAATQ